MTDKLSDHVTVLIAARNAASTIVRAISSVRAESDCPIILVDDHSDDNTVMLARQASKYNLEVVVPDFHGNLGFTRHCGLIQIRTEYTILLDADDAFVPGRISRFYRQISSGLADIWADELLLHDGLTGRFIRHITIPESFQNTSTPYKLLERNTLPGIGQVGYRTSLAQEVGYDPDLHGPEDIDLVLRMLMIGARFCFDRHPGYLMYGYPTSVSRNLDRQKAMYARCLAKFSPGTVVDFYINNGASKLEASFGLLLVFLHQRRFNEAMDLLDQVGTNILFEHTNLAAGISFYRWAFYFYRGSISLELGNSKDALNDLSEAIALRRSADTLNNLGCCFRAIGMNVEANDSFTAALRHFPHYLDARINLLNGEARRITLPALRTDASRDTYSVIEP